MLVIKLVLNGTLWGILCMQNLYDCIACSFLYNVLNHLKCQWRMMTGRSY